MRLGRWAAATVALTVFLGLKPVAVIAANFTWDGGSAANSNWTTPANWSSDAAPPGNGTASLTFAGFDRLTATNDFAASTTFTDLNFSGLAGAFTLSGNSITLAGNITDSTPYGTQTVSLPIGLSDAAHTINVASRASLTLSGSISGAGPNVNLVKTGAGELTLGASNPFISFSTASGPLTIQQGRVNFAFSGGTDDALGAVPLLVAPNWITIDGGTLRSTSTGAISTTHGIAVGNSSGTLEAASGTTESYGGVISGFSGGTGGLNKEGFGTLRLFGANTYKGPTVVRNGTLTLDYSDAAAPTSQILYSGVGSGRNLTLGKTATAAGSDNFLIGYAALVATGSSAGSATPVSQTFDATTFGLGVSRVAVTKGTNAGSTTTVDLGAITHVLPGTTYFLLPTKSAGSTSNASLNDPGIFITPTLTATAGTVHATSTNSNGTTGAANGILGGWAYIADTLIGRPFPGAVNGFEVPSNSGMLSPTEFASVDATGNILPFTGYTNLGPTNNTGSNLKITSDPNAVIDFKVIYTDTRATAQFLANTVTNGQITVQFATGTDTSMIQLGQFFSHPSESGGVGANSGLLWSSVVGIDSPTQIRLQPFPTGTTFGTPSAPSPWSIYDNKVQQLEMAAAGLTDINSIRIEEAMGRSVKIGTNNTLRLGKTGAIFNGGFSLQLMRNLIGTQANPALAGPGTGIQDDGVLTAGGPDVAGVAQPGQLYLQLSSAQPNGTFAITAKITENPGDDNNPNAGGSNGAVTLVKSGAGPLSLDGNNTYSGGTYILEGRVTLSGGETKIADSITNGLANPGGFGSGPVYILPGAEWFASGISSSTIFTNDLFLAGSGTVQEPFGAIRFVNGKFVGKTTLIGDTRLGGGFAGQAVITGQITGGYNLEFGVLTTINTELTLSNSSVANPNNWTGNTTIQGHNSGTGLVHLGENEQIPNGAGFGNLILRGGQNLTNDAILDLNGHTETVNGLVGTTNATQTRIENRAGSTTATLLVGDTDASSTFNGKIQDGNNGVGSGTVALTKIGAGLLQVGGPLIYTGATTINNGTLQLDATQALKKLKLDGSAATLKMNTATSSANSLEVTAAGGTINHAVNAFSVVGGTGESITWNGGAQLHVRGSSGGKVVLNAAAGTGVTVADNTALITVHPGATLELSGSVSATSSGANFVNIQNDSSTSLHVTGTNQQLGNVDGLGNTTVDANKDLTASRIVQNQLTVAGDEDNPSALVKIRRSGGNPEGLNSQASVLNSLALANDGATIVSPPPEGFGGAIRQYFGSLDLVNNDLIITGGSRSFAAEIQDAVRGGLYSGGASGIFSSEALSTGDYAGLTWLGMIYNGYDDDNDADTPDVPLLSEFDGQPLMGGEILLKYTWFGDADLNGNVDGSDVGLFSAGYFQTDPNVASNPWFFGDFDYNGIIDENDLGALSAGYFGGNEGAIHLPEPGGSLLMALAAIALLHLARRRAA